MATTSKPATPTPKQSASFKPPSYQTTRYLDGCGAIVSAWHNRFAEIKGTSKEGTSENNALMNDEPAINESYAAFFRTEISSSDAAKLRRCQDIQDVAIQPAFIALWQQVQPKLLKHRHTISDNTFAAWLAVAWVLAQVRTTSGRTDKSGASKDDSNKDNSNKDNANKGWQKNNTLAHIAGHKEKDSDRPLITPLRFEKLTSARDPKNFTKLLTRMVAQLQQQGHALDVISLANDILHWFADYEGANHRHPRDKLAVQWALAYYQASS